MTLNELKELSSRKLYAMWNRGEFPFDFAKNCGMCLVQHRTMPSGCAPPPASCRKFEATYLRSTGTARDVWSSSLI